MNWRNFTPENFALERWLPAGLTLADATALLAGLAVLTTFLAIWNALRGYNAFERRFAAIAQRKESLRQEVVSARPERPRLTPAGLMAEAVKRLNLLRSHHASEARMMLARAGMRSREAMIRYLFARVSLPFALAAAAVADNYTLHLLPVPEQFRLVAAGAAALAGFFLPDIYVKNLANKRSQRLQKALPDGLDLMVICAEAGLSLDATLMRVSRELESSWPELAEEFGITAAELTFLPDRRLAFENLNARTNMASIRGVVNTLQQTAKFGTPLAHSLRVLAAEFRDARMIRAEEKAARLPALMTVPMILFILPTLFIVLMGPAALSIIDTFSGNRNGPQKVTVVTHTGAGDGTAVTAPEVTEVQADDGKARGIDDSQTERPAGAMHATVTPSATTVAAGTPLAIDIDARDLASGSSHRVIIVPAGSPDEIVDQRVYMRDSVPIVPGELRITMVPARAGESEVRLYYLAQFGLTPTVAARAPIEVLPAGR
jgi:tight adherence protein C